MRVAASRSSWLAEILFHSNALPIYSIVVVTSCILAVGWYFGLPIVLSIYTLWQFSIGPITLVITFWILCFASLVIHRPEKPTRFILDRIFKVWRVPDHLFRGLPVFLLSAIPLSAFTSYKQSFPAIVPFYADPFLADLDALIHTTDPWRLLQPFLGYPAITHAINVMYLVWFPYMFFALAFGMFILPDVRLRAQYLSTFFLSWAVAGGIFATALSSVGPIFYLEFYDNDRFGELMSYLREADKTYPVHALQGHAVLLEKYRLNETGVGVGISAFPSMHVVIAVLNAVFLCRVNRIAGYLAWFYAVAIVIGSVHLAWHYAVDGYAAILLVLVIWQLAGKLSKALHPSDTEQRDGANGIPIPEITVPEAR